MSNRALTGNKALVPKLVYDITNKCSCLECSSFLIRLNGNARKHFHIDFYTREG